MYKVIAKDFEKNGQEHRLNLKISNEDKLIKKKTFTCSYNQFRNKRKRRLVSVCMIELEREGLENFESDYGSSDFLDDDRIEVVENFDNPYQ